MTTEIKSEAQNLLQPDRKKKVNLKFKIAILLKKKRPDLLLTTCGFSRIHSARCWAALVLKRMEEKQMLCCAVLCIGNVKLCIITLLH